MNERQTAADKRAALARLLQQRAAEANQPQPLAIAQERLWFLEQFEPGTALYAIPMTMALKGALETGALERSLNEIVRRQGALRLTFGADAEGRPYQTVGEFQPFALPVTDLSGQPDPEAEARRLAEQEGRRPFDVAMGPLVRFNLYRLGPEEHWLQVNLHHIIADGLSVGVIFREMAALYAAYTQGRTPALPDLPISYCAFARRQREELAGGALEPSLAYWQKKLGGPLPALQLPTDRPRPAVLGHAGEVLQVPLPPRLLEELKLFSRREGATLFMTLSAALNVLLHRYSRQADISIGTPIAGRPSADVEGLIGLFINTLVLRTDLSGRPSFRQLLRQVRETALEAYAHQAVPFAKLVEVLHPDRHLAGSPLFSVMFGLESDLADLKLPGLTAKQVYLSTGTAKFDLSLYITDNLCHWEYNTELFDAATIERMGAQFAVLLAAVVAQPDASIDALSLLPGAERQLVLKEWNAATKAEYRAEASVHQLVAEQAARTPDRVALVCEGAFLTYAELDGRANQLARYLRRLGVGPESLVAVALERSPEMVVALLGVLKAGGAYVPMDPAYPKDRLAYMLTDTGARVLLTQERLKGSLPAPEDGGQTVCLDADWAAIARESAAPLESATGPEHIAYVIYTSGSTGKPKGVQVLHRGLTNIITWTVQNHRFTPDDALLAVTSISFDIAGTELYPPLVSGGTVVLAGPQSVTDGARLAALCRDNRVTLVQGTPATFRILLAAGWQSRAGLTMIVGGEPLPRELAERLLAGGGALWNQYGPTETTVWSTAWQVDLTGPILIGRPVANTTCYILDHRLEPVPLGVPGALYIGGDGVARGYLNRPELTAERFLETPYGRLYKTGDLVRFLPDGQMECLGRLDNQVKIRGYRIELGEIEAVLEQHPAIAQAVVDARRDASGEYGLVGYYTPAPGAAPPVKELKAHLKEQLPEYMVPGLFMAVERFALTPSGKVDRKALPAPEGLRPDLGAEYQAPATDLEKRVAAIWQAVLRVEQVGLHDNFFDLGGHSLLLVQVQAKLKEALQVEIPLLDLFQYPTVQMTAQRVRALAGDAAAESAAPEVTVARRVVNGSGSREIAIIGMAGRFPGAADVESFWTNLAGGVHSIRHFTRAELEAAGVDPELLDHPNYVPAMGYLADADKFDAGFFGISPREAETLDPQQRLFLETAWTTLEHAGYDPERYGGRIGVYAGAGFNSYLLTNLTQNPAHIEAVGMYQVFIANDKDFIATRTAYKLNLKGPAVSVQTACSSSLVAVHQACQALLAGECDMALAGGAAVGTPLVDGYLYSEGHIASPDGYCRPFDEQAGGTVGGSGVGAVLLKRLEDALRDGDTIHAVIKGSAANNDGSLKVGFTAPSVEGQAKAIAEALNAAGVEPDSVGYVECHGTGTVLGDPIEMAGLTWAYRSLGARGTQYCAVGSVKSNVGHLDTAAGVTGLIKAALAVGRGQIPPSLHFAKANPKIDFA
ncbi:MAG TPA: amino acid adenylation domain-containing protein, partial [Symbiobacteriaceae bacterium]|nr:amino acid adenylation domain-containing protein [Symbiobacteriaceae bacterium]